jgi:hypothetical protein
MTTDPNKGTGANAGGPRRRIIRTRLAARIAHLRRWAANTVRGLSAKTRL